MESFNVEFAKLNIRIDSKYDFTKRFCTEYLTDGEADFCVSVTDGDIQHEIDISEFTPSPAYAESICVYRQIAEVLPKLDRFVFHGAVIEYGGRGYVFTAPSGTGKTTHIRLWQKFLDGVEIVNGDKPIFHIEDGTVTAYATPYAGKEGYQNHSSVALGGICIISRGTVNRIARLKPAEALSKLIRQIYIPSDPESANKTLELFDKLLTVLPIYLLECDMSEQAVKTSFEALTGLEYCN